MPNEPDENGTTSEPEGGEAASAEDAAAGDAAAAPGGDSAVGDAAAAPGDAAAAPGDAAAAPGGDPAAPPGSLDPTSARPDGDPSADLKLGLPAPAAAAAGGAGGEGKAKKALTKGQKARRGVLLLLLLLAVTFLVMKFLVKFEAGEGVPSGNTCAIGPDAPVSGAIDIPITEMMDFDGMTRIELLAARAEAVTRQPRLLVGDYIPSDEIFGDLEDALPWWGLDGERIHGPGPKAAEGASRDSALLLNPFILVGLEVALVQWGEWEVTRDSFVEEDMGTLEAALGAKPTRLSWYPQERRAEVAYDMRSYRKAFDAITAKLASGAELTALPRFKTGIGFTALNARDLGFNYIQLSIEFSGRGAVGATSSGLGELPPPPWPLMLAALEEAGGGGGGMGGGGGHGEEAPAEDEEAEPPPAPTLPVIELTSHLGESGACSIPEKSCNDLLDPHAGLREGIEILALPVRVTFHLWRAEPDLEAEVETPPDMTFVVAIE